MTKKKVKLMVSPSLSKEELNRLRGKKVEEVTQHRRNNIAGLPYLGWKGSTVDEYFVITFVAGVMTIAIDEREMKLSYADNLYVLGFSTEAYNRLKNPGTTNQDLLLYNVDIYYKELELLTFGDIMKLMGWKWKGKKHIEEDIVLSQYL